jgi:hypothetical protein
MDRPTVPPRAVRAGYCEQVMVAAACGPRLAQAPTQFAWNP